MAEPPTTTPLAPTPPERDLLLATKLHIPRPRPGWVPRPHLLERLGQGTAHTLTLVCAPAGFGKTSLLAEWARGRPEPVAWLSLDAGGGDPARFWRYVAAALLRGLQPPPLEAVLTVVVNELAGADEEVVLVLDDYHLIDALAVQASLTMLLEWLCGPLCDAVTGRADGQAMLEQIERANLFLVPLDDQRRWWRYHHLFADLLRARLAQQRPGRMAELHRAAAGWCEQHDLGDEAIGHALAADDPEGRPG